MDLDNLLASLIDDELLTSKYCTHNYEDCSCSYVIETITGEIIITSIDYLMNSHSLLLRILITNPDVQKEIIQSISQIASGPIIIESILTMF